MAKKTDPELMHVRVLYTEPPEISMSTAFGRNVGVTYRICAGRHWPARQTVEADVTLEELAALEADKCFDVQYQGKAPKAIPSHDLTPSALALRATAAETRVGELEALLSAATHRAMDAEHHAQQRVLAHVNNITAEYEKRIRVLESQVRFTAENTNREPGWFPGPEFKSPDDAEREAATRGDR